MSSNTERVDDVCDPVDAMVFSGDALMNRECLDMFKAYLVRWSNEAKRFEELLENKIEEEGAPLSGDGDQVELDL